MNVSETCISFVCAMSTREKAEEWIKLKVEKMKNDYNKDLSARFKIFNKFLDEYIGTV